jgi:hypothetical protein
MNDTKKRPTCQDCDKESEPAYDMSFTDIGEGVLHFCADHGPGAHRMLRILERTFETQTDFATRLAQAIAEESPS